MILRIFLCFLATFVTNGLARFGYVVLIPLLILSGKMAENQSMQLGSAMLGALQKHFSLEAIAKLSFLIIALSFFACFF